MRYKPRWYQMRSEPENMVPMQRDDCDSHPLKSLTIPRGVAELAHLEYADQGHGDQSLDQIIARHGFSRHEIIMLLADRCERLCAEINGEM